MTITVLDTCSVMARILRAPVGDRAELLRSMLEPISGIYCCVPQ